MQNDSKISFEARDKIRRLLKKYVDNVAVGFKKFLKSNRTHGRILSTSDVSINLVE